MPCKIPPQKKRNHPADVLIEILCIEVPQEDIFQSVVGVSDIARADLGDLIQRSRIPLVLLFYTGVR